MGFFEEFEKTVFMFPVLALVGAIGFGLVGIVGAIIGALTLGLPLVETIKLGFLGGCAFGGAMGVFLALEHLFKEAGKK